LFNVLSKVICYKSLYFDVTNQMSLVTDNINV